MYIDLFLTPDGLLFLRPSNYFIKSIWRGLSVDLLPRLLLLSLVMFFLKNSLQHLKKINEIRYFVPQLGSLATYPSPPLAIDLSHSVQAVEFRFFPVSKSILICSPLPFGRDLNSMIRFFILFSNFALSNNWGFELNKRERIPRKSSSNLVSYRSSADTPGSVNGFKEESYMREKRFGQKDSQERCLLWHGDPLFSLCLVGLWLWEKQRQPQGDKNKRA